MPKHIVSIQLVSEHDLIETAHMAYALKETAENHEHPAEVKLVDIRTPGPYDLEQLGEDSPSA